MSTPIYDVAIIGGGPAGQAAAQQSLNAGLSTIMLDEQARPGGQILRQPPINFSVQDWMAGTGYRRLRKSLAQTEADARLEWCGCTSVVGVEKLANHFRLTLCGANSGTVRARRLLVAAGCYDMPVPMPGWTLPGVMSVGAVQTMLKAQQVVAGQPMVLLGSHPLLLVLAVQVLAAGGKIAAILMPHSIGQMLRASLPHLAGALLTPAPLIAAAGAWLKLKRAGVPIISNAKPTGFSDEHGQLAMVEYRLAGLALKVSAQVAAMGYGFLPQSDLPRQIGAAVRWSSPAGGWECLCDAFMRSSVTGLYVAGETTGVAGADAALAEGAIAGLAMALDAGAISSEQALPLITHWQKNRQRMQPFINLLRAVANPSDVWPQAMADTLVCRCEDITLAQVDAKIGQLAQQDPDASAIKHRCRIGMGLCQGRSCEHALVRRIAKARGCSPNAVRPFRPRFPARPVPIDELLG